jgi:heme-degrading monooxygenase HmoA
MNNFGPFNNFIMSVAPARPHRSTHAADHLSQVLSLDKGRNSRMITVANRIYVKQEYADAFEQRFRERAGLVDKMPGFISNHVLRPVNDGEPYVVFTFWNTRQDFLNWVRSDAFVKGHAQSGTLPKDAFSQSNVLEMHEVVQDSTRPDLEPEAHGGPFKMH